MKQYCRYCAYMCVTDTHGCYCDKHEKFKTESFAKHTNTCTDFEFCEMDAFMENPNAYKPRREKTQEEIMVRKNQTSFL